ncbi:replication initiator protein A [Ruminococcus sp. 210702-SL.1.03]|uniref:replication initiator protein A n=1 Tax=Ruminococcus sp. 210702-SL.1.03 TaxID=2883233 RepID=UPI001D093E58|nr:replication initiator protein A [Ruminococcus sp. 210702-SL.1.03]MCB6616255.1 replication initiator protein A [Ruminococcus sp. 210702-SL.1.03]
MNCEFINIHEYDDRKYRYFKLYKYLMLDDSFSDISTSAKIAYSLFENRHQLSVDNDIKDKNGRPYIFFSRNELIEALNCSTHKAAEIIKELLTAGLIERSTKLGGFNGEKNKGQYRLYVNDYVTKIKNKAQKSRNGSFDTMKSRDFFMIPFSLFTRNTELFALQINVKVTYAILLNMVNLSARSDHYHDEHGNIYVKLTIEQLQKIFGNNCSAKTAARYFNILSELGLIERKRRGAEHVIFVKHIVDKTDTTAADKTDTTAADKTDTTVVDKTDTTVVNKTDTTVLDKTDTTVLDKTCTQIRRKELELITRREELELFKLEKANGNESLRTQLENRWDLSGYLELAKVLGNSDVMIKQKSEMFDLIVTSTLWLCSFKGKEINIAGNAVSRSDAMAKIVGLDSFDVNNICDELTVRGENCNLNYIIGALFFAAENKEAV